MRETHCTFSSGNLVNKSKCSLNSKHQSKSTTFFWKFGDVKSNFGRKLHLCQDYDIQIILLLLYNLIKTSNRFVISMTSNCWHFNIILCVLFLQTWISKETKIKEIPWVLFDCGSTAGGPPCTCHGTFVAHSALEIAEKIAFTLFKFSHYFYFVSSEDKNNISVKMRLVLGW